MAMIAKNEGLKPLLVPAADAPEAALVSRGCPELVFPDSRRKVRATFRGVNESDNGFHPRHGGRPADPKAQSSLPHYRGGLGPVALPS